MLPKDSAIGYICILALVQHLIGIAVIGVGILIVQNMGGFMRTGAIALLLKLVL